MHAHLFFLQALDLDSITTHHWLIQGCSAVTGENLLLGIDWIIDDIASRIFSMTKNLHLHMYLKIFIHAYVLFLYVSSEGFGESAHMCRLA